MWYVSMILIALVILIGTSIVWYTVRIGISPMPSSAKATAAMLQIMPPRVVGTIYEMGAGWGGMGIALARKYPDRAVVGYELSPIPARFAQIRARLFGVANIEFRRADFMAADLRDAGLVVCYLFPGGMKTLTSKLTKELADGTTVVSNTFRLPNWQADETITLSDIYKTPVYRYQLVRQQ